MRTERLVEFGFHQCDDCEEIHHAVELNDIENFSARVTAGATVPSGECPSCGSLCYPLPEGTEIEEVVAISVGVAVNVNAKEGRDESVASMNCDEAKKKLARSVQERLRDLIEDEDACASQINEIEVMARRIIK